MTNTLRDPSDTQMHLVHIKHGLDKSKIGITSDSVAVIAILIEVCIVVLILADCYVTFDIISFIFVVVAQALFHLYQPIF